MTNTTDKTKQVALNIIEGSFDTDTAEAILNLLTEQMGLDLEAIATEVREANPDTTGDNLDSLIDDAISSELTQFGMSERPSGVVDIDGQGQSWLLGTQDDMHREAVDYIHQMIDDGAVSDRTIINSWTSGQTRDEFCEEAVDTDGIGHTLGSYDGDEHEFRTSSGKWFSYVRTG